MTSQEAVKQSNAAASGPVLEIRDVVFRYPGAGSTSPAAVAIKELLVGAGEHVLISASSGAGKSTLLQIIAGVLDVQRGDVRVQGQRVHELMGSQRDRFRGAHIGMIFQTFQLLPGFTARENVETALMLGGVRESEHAARAGELLGKLGLERVDAPVEELSVGQQQRVAVARAVACRPALVLADEPTASLDVENAQRAMDVIQGACRDVGAALVCVSHDPTMSARFDRTMRLAELDAGFAVGTEVGR